MAKKMLSSKVDKFTESIIREMTRQANKYGAVNLSQGFPDFPAPEEIKIAAAEAIEKDINQYAITWGAKRLRDAIATKTKDFLGLEVDPETEICVTCGSTEGMISSVMAITEPEDEIVVFSPYYENYWPDAVLSGAKPVFVDLKAPDWTFDREQLAAAFNEKTKAIIICNPNNPTGKVFTQEELYFIADLCIKWDALAITDEIYEHIIYNGLKHISMATLDGMKDRTITVNSLSKTYSVTGWRVGYIIASPYLMSGIRKVHDFLTVGAAAPLQEAAATALGFPKSYYDKLAADYQQKCDYTVSILKEVGFKVYEPQGAYYVMVDFSNFGFDNDIEFAKFMVQQVGVAVVPGSSFYIDQQGGKQQVRFAFCKRNETLQAAAEKLQRLKELIDKKKSHSSE